MRYFKGGDMSTDIFSKLFVQTPASIANKADVDYTLPCYSDSLQFWQKNNMAKEKETCCRLGLQKPGAHLHNFDPLGLTGK